MIRILIVDDDTDILDVMKLEFEDDPEFSVETASSGMRALQLAKTNHFDAVIADYRMPGLDGISLLRRLREQGSRAFFVIYSGALDNGSLQGALHQDVDAILPRRGVPEYEFPQIRSLILEHTKKSAPGSSGNV